MCLSIFENPKQVVNHSTLMGMVESGQGFAPDHLAGGTTANNNANHQNHLIIQTSCYSSLPLAVHSTVYLEII